MVPAMTQPGTRPAAVWFLYSEDGLPLGQVYRNIDDTIPTTGTQLANGERWNAAEVVSFEELTTTCAMRRFRVVLRLLM